MRSLLLAAAILAFPSSAYAMGVYVEIHVAAWNNDGTAALVTSTSSSSGTVGKTKGYMLVAAGEAQPLAVSFDETTRRTPTRRRRRSTRPPASAMPRA
jgi:hypothetical protein